MNAWLKCSLESGMLPGEFAAEVETTNCGQVSLFVWDQLARYADGLIQVEVFNQSEGETLVKLPSQPFEISSRFVRVVNAHIQS